IPPLLRALVPRLPRGVMDVEYLDSISGGPIKDFVGVASEWHHANVRAVGGPACARRPPRDVSHDAPDTLLDNRCDRRIMNAEPIGNRGEVVEGFVGIDDLHRV